MQFLMKCTALPEIKYNPERAYIISVDKPDREYALMKAIEETENGLCLCRYANGAGWLFTRNMIAKAGRDNISLESLFADMQGKHTGDITIMDSEDALGLGDDVIEEFINGDHGKEYKFMRGSDREFKRLLPMLNVGEYCFIFR